MARVRTFRINPQYGVPDKDIAEFLTKVEKEDGCIDVKVTVIPAMGDADPRICVVTTRLDPPA